MALVIYWYDFVCFGIVGVAYIGSLWILWRRELSCKYNVSNTLLYESLVEAGRPNSNHVGSSQLWSSCWKGFHPAWLFATRFISFLVMAAFLLWDLQKWDASIFMYYTEWTFALVIVYFAIASVTSGYGWWITSMQVPCENEDQIAEVLEGNAVTDSITYKEIEAKGSTKLELESHYAEKAITRRAGFWGYLMQTIYQTCAGAVILTDIVFWCIIIPFGSSTHLRLNVLMGCMHTLNAVFLLLDTALNSLPFPWFRLAYFVQWSCIYIVFQWIIHACGFKWWPYPFLELEIPWAPLWYFILAVIHVPCYWIYALIVKAKNTFFPRWFPDAFVRSF